MNRKDVRYQLALEQEKLRLCNLPLSEILALDPFTTQDVQVGDKQIQIAIWHEEPCRKGEDGNHSFILQAQRCLYLVFYRNYLAGFAVDETGAIVPIEESVLYSYD